MIDLGSNTARVVVFRIGAGGSRPITADDKVALRLIRQLDHRHRLRPAAVERTLRVLADFRQIALGAGAQRIVPVATAALREAADGERLLERVRREVGLPLRILSPEAEARCAFLGAVYGVPVDHGIVLDIGGGSMQLGRFRDRRLLATWSLPLGALRTNDRFLHKDPPSRAEIRRAQAHATRLLSRAEIPVLAEDEALIGTGGSIRNLSKIDTRLRKHPIPRLQGYPLTRRRVDNLCALLAGRPLARRADLVGLNASRADSIVAGGFLVRAAMAHTGAGRLLVAGHGLREGLILEALGLALPEPRSVRETAVEALASRFACWDRRHAARRRQMADTLVSALLPEQDVQAREMLGHAATLLDIGRTVDYYRRHEHAAMIVRSSGLSGFTHRDILRVSLILEWADGPDPKKSYRPLLGNGDLQEIRRCAVLLAIADGIQHRLRARRRPQLRCRLMEGAFIIREDSLGHWEPNGLAGEFERAFGRTLRVGK